MLNPEQLEEKKRKILLVCEEFLNHDGCISVVELSNKVNIPKLSVQRYLKDPLVKTLLGNDIYDKISKMLELNKKEGAYKGGYIFSKTSTPIKNEMGHYINNERNKNFNKNYSVNEYAIAVKMAYYLIKNNCELSELTEVYNITIDEVEKNLYEVLRECDINLYNSIKIVLDLKNSQTFDKNESHKGHK